MIEVPTQAQLDAAAAVFADDWALVDDGLYGVCRRYPTRAYAASVERCINPPPGTQALMLAAESSSADAW